MINEMGSMMYYQMGYSNANNTVVQESSQTASQTPTLYSNEYFKSHSIKPNNATELYELIGNNDVFVYFYMTTCGYCTLTAPYVEQYIKDGKTESMPIYFIDASMLDWVWGGEGNNRSNITDTDIDITGTPTMLAFRSDKTIQEGIGPYEISAMLGYEYQE